MCIRDRRKTARSWTLCAVWAFPLRSSRCCLKSWRTEVLWDKVSRSPKKKRRKTEYETLSYVGSGALLRRSFMRLCDPSLRLFGQWKWGTACCGRNSALGASAYHYPGRGLFGGWKLYPKRITVRNWLIMTIPRTMGRLGTRTIPKARIMNEIYQQPLWGIYERKKLL